MSAGTEMSVGMTVTCFVQNIVTIVETVLVVNDCNILKTVKDILKIDSDTAGIVEQSLYTCPRKRRY